MINRKAKYLIKRSGEKIRDAVGDEFRQISLKLNKSDPEKVTNEKEIRVLGLRRSGNHAVINWILKQLSENHVFINCCRTTNNPYRDVYRDQILKQNNPERRGIRYENLQWWKEESRGNLSFKECLIYSFEDQEISRIKNSIVDRKHDLFLGKSRQRYDVIVMRDPFNLMASRIQASKSWKGDKQQFDFLKVYSKKLSVSDLWISYAKECLGETTYLENHKVVINYNLWFSDIEYRKRLANQLGLTFSDAGLYEVSEAGGGSSFEKRKLDGKAEKMKVLNRWEDFIENPIFLGMVNNKNLIEYSNKLFGHIPGTEKLLTSL